MECLLIRYNLSPIKFNINDIISITANGNLIYVKLDERTTHVGYMIKPNNI